MFILNHQKHLRRPFKRARWPVGPARWSNVLALAFIVLGALAATPVEAQTVALLRGEVTDPQGAFIPGVTVSLRQGASGLERATLTDNRGHFEIGNLPLGTYDLRLELSGFAPEARRIDLASSVPVELAFTLRVADVTDTITVTPEAPVVDTTSAGTRHVISETRIERLPVAASSRGLEAVLVSFPGFAQNANGAIHPRGAHNQMTFVVDGLPISDQLTGAFANSLDVGVVQTVELITGHVPAEFGSKVSGVAVLNSRSGLGTGRPIAGTVSGSLGGFGTRHGVAQLGGERGRVGYFGSVTAMHTDRFLDQVSLDNLHNTGGYARGFGRVDLRLTDRDTLRLHAMGGRSSFELANLRSQEAAGQDQRQTLADASLWASYVRPLDTQSTLEATVGYRTTTAVLTSSPGDTPVTATQDRRLSTFTANTRYTRSFGAQTVRAGVDLQRFPVDELFTMGLTSLAFNAPDAEGYNAALLPYDLTRGGVPFVFADAQTGTQVSAFVQSTIRFGNVSLALGLRHDEYRFLVDGRHLQPRVGVAYRIPGHDLVLRASYNRNYQTPPNENLLLSSSEAASRLAPDSVREALGGAYQPIRPERQDVYEVGGQLPVGRFATLDGSVYRKNSVDQQDNNNFFDTGIIFPTTLKSIRVTGAEARLSFIARRGLMGALSATMGRAISSPPFTGGLFLGQDAVDLLSAGPFVIDHDQRLGVHGTASYDAPGPLWLGGSIRYDSGLVSNPSDPAIVAADSDFADLLPFVNLEAEVPRVRPRTIVDLAAGFDVNNSRGRRAWTLQAQVTNATNQTALYNFQSVFVGTRLVQPRTVAVRLARHF
ncbi:MAG: carboxypeptidase regulatory-like domain-containing protein [Acidobacteria bacterium]|nr:carboxypeptidase regulatory-like domain-containing protein [Acidobacteriota bacterium]